MASAMTSSESLKLRLTRIDIHGTSRGITRNLSTKARGYLQTSATYNAISTALFRGLVRERTPEIDRALASSSEEQAQQVFLTWHVHESKNKFTTSVLVVPGDHSYVTLTTYWFAQATSQPIPAISRAQAQLAQDIARRGPPIQYAYASAGSSGSSYDASASASSTPAYESSIATSHDGEAPEFDQVSLPSTSQLDPTYRHPAPAPSAYAQSSNYQAQQHHSAHHSPSYPQEQPGFHVNYDWSDENAQKPPVPYSSVQSYRDFKETTDDPASFWEWSSEFQKWSHTTETGKVIYFPELD